MQSCQFYQVHEKPQIVTTLFPLYDFTKNIVGDKFDVILILPPGEEPHSFEPKPRSIFEIRSAELFIYTGDFLEVWAKRITSVLDKDRVINSSLNINLIDEEHEHEENHHHHHEIDPHIWIDPQNAKIMIDNILEGIISIDPTNKTYYESNAENYKKELDKLDLTYQDLFNNVQFKTIIYAGHFVFGYLAKRYDIEYISPYNGFSSDSLPTPKNINDLINLIKTTNQHTIFYEETVNPKVAKVIVEETNVNMLPLNGGGNISKKDFEDNVSYLTLMYQNIDNLKKGLGYNE